MFLKVDSCKLINDIIEELSQGCDTDAHLFVKLTTFNCFLDEYIKSHFGQYGSLNDGIEKYEFLTGINIKFDILEDVKK